MLIIIGCVWLSSARKRFAQEKIGQFAPTNTVLLYNSQPFLQLGLGHVSKFWHLRLGQM